MWVVRSARSGKYLYAPEKEQALGSALGDGTLFQILTNGQRGAQLADVVGTNVVKVDTTSVNQLDPANAWCVRARRTARRRLATRWYASRKQPKFGSDRSSEVTAVGGPRRGGRGGVVPGGCRRGGFEAGLWSLRSVLYVSTDGTRESLSTATLSLTKGSPSR